MKLTYLLKLLSHNWLMIQDMMYGAKGWQIGLFNNKISFVGWFIMFITFMTALFVEEEKLCTTSNVQLEFNRNHNFVYFCLNSSLNSVSVIFPSPSVSSFSIKAVVFSWFIFVPSLLSSLAVMYPLWSLSMAWIEFR